MQNAAMSEPVGTTRKGQLLLGVVGLLVGAGGGLGLILRPAVFEPVLDLALDALAGLLRTHLHYDPSQRAFFAILLPSLGVLWATLFAYAFAREPARNRAIDAYLRREDGMENLGQATVIYQDDQPF